MDFLNRIFRVRRAKSGEKNDEKEKEEQVRTSRYIIPGCNRPVVRFESESPRFAKESSRKFAKIFDPICWCTIKVFCLYISKGQINPNLHSSKIKKKTAPGILKIACVEVNFDGKGVQVYQTMFLCAFWSSTKWPISQKLWFLSDKKAGPLET